jgi:signal transduction histidine kinase
MITVPLFAYSVFTSLEAQRFARDDAFNLAFGKVKDISRLHETIIDNTRTLLTTLSHMTPVRKLDHADSQSILADLISEHRIFTSANIILPNGDLYVTTHPVMINVNYADRLWFQSVMKTQSFSLGEYVIGRLTGKPILSAAAPIMDEEGNLKAILGVGINLDALDVDPVKAQLPEGSVVTVIDQKGTILMRNPADGFIGKAIPEAEIIRKLLSQKEGTVEALGIDGKERLYGFTKLGPAGAEIHVAAGIPVKAAFAKVRMMMITRFSLLSFITLLVYIGALWMNHRYMEKPVRRLLMVTRRVADGDLAARTDLVKNTGEIGDLSAAFDHMADSLQERETALRNALSENEHLIKNLEGIVKERTGEMEAARIRAEAANQAKSDFLSNMSHELRTPLNAVIGFSEILEDGIAGDLNERQKTYAGHIYASGMHLLGLINDILDLTKVEAGKMEFKVSRFPIRSILDLSVILLSEKAMKKGIALSIEIAPDADIDIEADAQKIKQILFNLLSNAVKFTPDGGRVTMRASLASLENGGQERRMLEVCIEDTGIGIKEEDFPRLFCAFTQIHASVLTKEYEGTGLGLALTRRLVERHHGSIWVESEYGKGSRFYFTLPVSGNNDKLNLFDLRQDSPLEGG